MKRPALSPLPFGDDEGILSRLQQNTWLVELLLLVGGLGLGGGIAYLVSRGQWAIAAGAVLGIPLLIVLNRYPLGAFFLWCATMPLLPFQTVPPQVFWVVHRALIPLALILVIAGRLLRDRPYDPVKLGWPELMMVLYLLFGAVTVLATRKAPLLYLYELYDRMGVPFAAYWLMRLTTPDKHDFKRLLPLLLGLCLAEILIGFWARYLPGLLPPLWQIERMGDRMSGTFANPTPYAYTLSFCLPLLFHTALTRFTGTVRNLLLGVFGLGLVCIFLTFTRGCWGAALVMLLGLLLLYPRTVARLIVFGLPLFLLLFGGLMAQEFATALTRLETQDTVDSRIVLAHAGERMFALKPITGWGFGNYDRYDWQFMERVGNAAPTNWDVQYGTSHNTFLTILAETGLVGFSTQFFPLFWWAIQSLRVWRRMPRRGFWSRRLLAVLWLSILFYLVASQVVDMRFFWFQIGTWWATLGLIGSLVERYQSHEPRQIPAWLLLSAERNSR